MKTKDNAKNTTRTVQKFDAVKFMREQRDRIGNDIADMSTEEIIEYFNSRNSKKRVKPSA